MMPSIENRNRVQLTDREIARTFAQELREIFNLPEQFPHQRYLLESCIDSGSARGRDRQCFLGADTESGQKVFVKFVSRIDDLAGVYRDYQFSHGSTDPYIVPALKLYDVFSETLKGCSRVDDARIEVEQSLGFDSFMEYVERTSPDMKVEKIWIALIKQRVPDPIPIHQYLQLNRDEIPWLKHEVKNLVTALISRGILVRDIFFRPDNSLSGNVLVVPSERRICISDLEYSDPVLPASFEETYDALTEEFFQWIDSRMGSAFSGNSPLRPFNLKMED